MGNTPSGDINSRPILASSADECWLISGLSRVATPPDRSSLQVRIGCNIHRDRRRYPRPVPRRTGRGNRHHRKREKQNAHGSRVDHPGEQTPETRASAYPHNRPPGDHPATRRSRLFDQPCQREHGNIHCPDYLMIRHPSLRAPMSGSPQSQQRTSVAKCPGVLVNQNKLYRTSHLQYVFFLRKFPFLDIHIHFRTLEHLPVCFSHSVNNLPRLICIFALTAV